MLVRKKPREFSIVGKSAMFLFDVASSPFTLVNLKHSRIEKEHLRKRTLWAEEMDSLCPNPKFGDIVYCPSNGIRYQYNGSLSSWDMNDSSWHLIPEGVSNPHEIRKEDEREKHKGRTEDRIILELMARIDSCSNMSYKHCELGDLKEIAGIDDNREMVRFLVIHKDIFDMKYLKEHGNFSLTEKWMGIQYFIDNVKKPEYYAMVCTLDYVETASRYSHKTLEPDLNLHQAYRCGYIK